MIYEVLLLKSMGDPFYEFSVIHLIRRTSIKFYQQIIIHTKMTIIFFFMLAVV